MEQHPFTEEWRVDEERVRRPMGDFCWLQLVLGVSFSSLMWVKDVPTVKTLPLVPIGSLQNR